MSKKSKFYDIVPKENKSIRNIPIPEKGTVNKEGYIDSDELHQGVEMIRKNRHSAHKEAASNDSATATGANSRGSVKKSDHKESSSVEIKKLERPITNVDEYNEDEYIEIIDHKTSDDEVAEEIHILGENKEQIEKTKIPALAETENEDFSDYTKNTINNGRRKKYFFTGFFRGSYKLPVLVFVILIVCFFALTFFSSATVIVKTSDLKASLGDGYNFDAGDGEVLQSTSSDSISTDANGTVRLDKKSVGTVVIFNNTTAGQKLTKGTRLQASNGLVYLLDSAVTVPAKKTVAKKVVLGSVTTTVTAETVGDKYNSGPKDFTFIGFKGTAKFDNIYGRSKGNLTGGFSGDVPNISQKDLVNQIADAKDKMRSTLLALLKSQADSRDLIINNDTLQYKIINSETRLSDDKKQAIVKIDGTVQVETLLNASMTEASKTILGAEDVNGFKYEVNLASSTIDISNSTSTNNGQITATGDVQVKISINKDELTKSLQNKSKKDALALLQQTKGVTYAQIKIFPFWKMALPKAAGITILVQD